MTTLTEFKEIETPLLKFLRYFRDEKATGTLAYDELQHHIAEYTALLAVAEGMENVMVQFKGYIKLMPEGLVGSLEQDIKQALAAYEAWKGKIEGEGK